MRTLNQALRVAFGAEWDQLTLAQQTAIVRDWTETTNSDPTDTLFRYRQSIGAGNLLSYAKCLGAQQ